MSESTHSNSKKKKNGAQKKRRHKTAPLVQNPYWAEYLKDEWDYEKNQALGLNPETLSSGSNKTAWWIGPCGHGWDAKVNHRATIGAGCPYCSGRRTLRGFNDLASQRPEIAREWHSGRNENLTPEDISVASGKTVWWLGSCNHAWQASVASRTVMHSGCPYCSGNKVLKGFNDLATTDKDVAKEWHPTLNGRLTPQDVSRKSSRKVWWLGPCGHAWETAIANRTSAHSRCPYCFGTGRGQKILIGFNDLKTTNPSLVREWHPTKNQGILPEELSAGSQYKAWWKCEKCGNEWQAAVSSRACAGSGCPRCRRSRGEKNIEAWAESKGLPYHPQWKDAKCRDTCELPFDLMLYIPTGSTAKSPLMELSLIEYDGEHHSDAESFYNLKNQLRGGIDYVIRHDTIKNEFCVETNRILIRVPYTIVGVHDIGQYIEGILASYGFYWLKDMDVSKCPS